MNRHGRTANTNSSFYFPTHIPALVSAAFIAVNNWLNWNRLPRTLAVHFDAAGRPNGYMSREVSVSIPLGIIAVFIVINIVIGIAWSNRHLSRHFNFLSVVYAAVCALMVWADHGISQFNLSGGVLFSLNPLFAAIAIGSALIFSIVVEYRRVQAAKDSDPEYTAPAASAPQSEIQLKNPARFYIEQRSNPWWWNPLLLGSTLVPLGVMYAGIAASSGSHPNPAVHDILTYFILPLSMVILLPVTVAFFGGFRYMARPDGLTVKLGLFGFPLKRIPLESITKVSLLRDFMPLGTFLGYGWRIRRSDRLTGYCLCSGDAVKIETADWSYILVMDEAEDFAGVLEQAIN